MRLSHAVSARSECIRANRLAQTFCEAAYWYAVAASLAVQSCAVVADPRGVGLPCATRKGHGCPKPSFTAMATDRKTRSCTTGALHLHSPRSHATSAQHHPAHSSALRKHARPGSDVVATIGLQAYTGPRAQGPTAPHFHGRLESPGAALRMSVMPLDCTVSEAQGSICGPACPIIPIPMSVMTAPRPARALRRRRPAAGRLAERPARRPAQRHRHGGCTQGTARRPPQH